MSNRDASVDQSLPDQGLLDARRDVQNDTTAIDTASEQTEGSYNPPGTCAPMLNPGSGFFELQIDPGSAGNFSRTCQFQNRMLTVTGGNFGVTFELNVDVSSQAGTYVLPRGALRITDSRGTTFFNSGPGQCTLCLDRDLVGNLTCGRESLCASDGPSSCGAGDETRAANASFDC